MVKNQNGQMVVEMILILTALFAFTLLVSSRFKGENYFQNLVSGPWVYMEGLIQNGVWGPANQTHQLHPNQHGRHSSLNPPIPINGPRGYRLEGYY